MNISEYVKEIKTRYARGISTEHSYRADLQVLIKDLVSGIDVTNEPKRQECGAPDYIITRAEIPIGFIEAKDVGVDLDKIEKSKQLKRYLSSLDNLILTDYLEFRLYRQGEKVMTVTLGHLEGDKVKSDKDNWETFETLIKDFCSYSGQTITNAEKLARMMANKAKLMQEIILYTLTHAEDKKENTLYQQLQAFRQILIHGLREESFADIYAQTITYGLFAARLNDTTLEDFSRQEALFLIPKSNPFLRQLFTYIAGPELDERISWIVDALADVFRACDLRKLLESFGSATQQTDPMIHFYETFLSEYDPKLRKSRGVYYTPEPVVNFIVRAVDDILKEEFGLSQGLADTSTIEIDVDVQGQKKPVKKTVHKVQILDPASGTGTFLAEVIKQIYKKFENQQGIWSDYVEKHLIPRLHGFEILMAPYTICHLKLEMLLRETGYKPKGDQRLGVYLTNALEESHPDTGTLFATWLSKEATEANHVKKETPVMVVIGNPPYSVSSSNKGEWIENLVADYKKDLNEKNIQPLSDDYIKFIRYAEHYIDKTGQGIVAMITNNCFLDGIIHRKMRQQLIETFDKIFLINLHGDSKRREISKDGGKDENVFDITQGVSINIFIKTSKRNSSNSTKIYYSDYLGKRVDKYKKLLFNNIALIEWENVNHKKPSYYFIPKNFKKEEQYNEFIKIQTLFHVFKSGIKFRKDNLLIKNNFTRKDVETMLFDICELPKTEILQKYNISETKDWKLDEQRQYFGKQNVDSIQKVNYRPFDFRYTYYPIEYISKIIPRGDSRKGLMSHFLNKNNIGIILGRQGQVVGSMMWNLIFVSRNLIDMNLFYRGGEIFCPLYLYNPNMKEKYYKKLNLNSEIINLISEKINIKFKENSEDRESCYTSIDIMDYIYGVLHSPNYRKTFKEFLKIDFPRIPYPDNAEMFWEFVEKGKELRKLHLMESSELDNLITSYPVDGDNIVENVKFTGKNIGQVWINKEQYFDRVPRIAWEFYIGGYQPAQKWLKDRKDRQLTYDDIIHYQKIIVALTRTHEIMIEIDKIKEF